MIRQIRRVSIQPRKALFSLQASVTPTPLISTITVQKTTSFDTSSFVRNFSCIVTASEGSFSHVANETLESLSDKFSELFEEEEVFASADIILADGVLTAQLGPNLGIYVINKQTPNRQLWLSSPVSGPSRFDWDQKEQVWVYQHTRENLHKVLDREVGELLRREEVGFQKDCHLGGGGHGEQ